MWRSCFRLGASGGSFPCRPCLVSAAPVGSGDQAGPLSLLRRSYAPPAERKKFYQNVSITQGEGGYEINLDHRKLKTPNARLFTVPSKALAVAVATEWDSQQDTIKFYTMHLTTLCNTSLDNPSQRNKDQLIHASMKFLDTDTICYRVEEPETLVELQKNEWDPVIEWAEKRYDVKLGSSTNIMGPDIPAKTKEVFISHLASYNMWALQDPEMGQRGVGPRLRTARTAGSNRSRDALCAPLLGELRSEAQTPAGVRPGKRQATAMYTDSAFSTAEEREPPLWLPGRLSLQP
ncbi:ATP synthase mitochondrial F1 complex assembly factor 2 isoform X2 [Monodelphis domestica]|uniref:ATP synthase mitochondrial F1 complex assembly factor 2 isoform X2 n=1 Tax=Monodelphis domestica TaxID=13616 RepID=UPI0024E1FC1F|nr:ATP synthase mitochondrial F1 complex assembly factor 2 isoform X2 [Monodelphis domestica]